VRFPCVHAVATTPAQRLGVLLRSLHPAVSAFPDMAVGSACALSFSRFARRSLRYGLHTRAVTVYRDPLTEGFSHFVTSIAAPVASGWSARRVGFAPTGKRRLSTAHAIAGLMQCSKDFNGAFIEVFLNAINPTAYNPVHSGNQEYGGTNGRRPKLS
jgi:hypothetical protein